MEDDGLVGDFDFGDTVEVDESFSDIDEHSVAPLHLVSWSQIPNALSASAAAVRQRSP